MPQAQSATTAEPAFSGDFMAQFFARQSELYSQLNYLQFNTLHPNHERLDVPDWLRDLIDPDQFKAIQQTYLDDLNQLIQTSFHQPNQPVAGAKEQTTEPPRPALSDRRFNSQAWRDQGVYEFISNLYLLNARTLNQLAESVRADAKTKQKLRFAVAQFVDAMSPANFLATNPEAQKKIIETKGESLKAGIENLLRDLQKGRISMTDESQFEVGRNVATTPGAVVFENAMFQLIQYRPTTPAVGARPLLMVPPCINKYYILDLQPANSIVRYAVEQGMTVFMVSWRTPTDELSQWTWNDYIEDGVIRAIDVALTIGKAATKADQINLLGFCVGGTMVANALAVMAERGQKPAASLTLLTTLLDFSNTGMLDVFIDEPQVRMREETIGRGGLMRARDLATTFSFLRPNDLVWPYVVGNYLKGETPPAFDLLYWNADGTHLPGPMYAWYLRNTYLENNLMKPRHCNVGGTPVDLNQLDMPVYLYASRDDHIVPWESAYASIPVLKNADWPRSRFVLGASGHIAGVINSVSANKRNYWVSPSSGAVKTAAKSTKRQAAPVLPESPNDWFAQAQSKPGSWWADWADWIGAFKGQAVKVPAKAGSAKHPEIEPAPGRYVAQRVV